jgi:dihydroorotate dehydrogenase electron transfer subunit
LLIPPFLATQAIFCSGPVVRNDRLARDTYRLRIEAPEIGARILPGQFVMLRLAQCDDPLIGRPLALFDTYLGVDGTVLGLDLVYLVAGKLTTRLQELTCGAQVELWGPLGNGFLPQTCRRMILVAGGIGQTPFLAVAQSALGVKQYGPKAVPAWASEVLMCYGVRTADYFAALDDFHNIGVEMRLATEDGSRGHHGLVTDLLTTELRALDARVLCCGPDRMMAAVAEICRAGNVECHVSLETPMACGFGACFTCVAPMREDPASPEWDYRRTCVEGPVVDARRVVWQEMDHATAHSRVLGD